MTTRTVSHRIRGSRDTIRPKQLNFILRYQKLLAKSQILQTIILSCIKNTIIDQMRPLSRHCQHSRLGQELWSFDTRSISHLIGIFIIYDIVSKLICLYSIEMLYPILEIHQFTKVSCSTTLYAIAIFRKLWHCGSRFRKVMSQYRNRNSLNTLKQTERSVVETYYWSLWVSTTATIDANNIRWLVISSSVE